MPLQTADRVRVIFTMWMDGQLGLNIRYYRITNVSGDPLTADQAANGFHAAFVNAYADLLVANAEFLGVSVRDITELPLAAAGTSNLSPTQGQVTGDPLPGQCTGLFKLRSVLAGRANRGRVYVPFPGEVDSDVEHIPTADYMTRLTTLAALMDDEIIITVGADSMTFLPVIKHSGAGDVDVVGTTTRQAWATQRRRGTLGRPNPRLIAL